MNIKDADAITIELLQNALDEANAVIRAKTEEVSTLRAELETAKFEVAQIKGQVGLLPGFTIITGERKD